MPHGVIGNTTVSEAVVPGSSPGGAANNAPVAQLDQSASLRTRRSQVRVLPGVPNDGLIAQLVERLLCKQRVRSSSLRGSTMMLPSSNRSGRHPFTVEIYGFEPRWQYRSILLWRNWLARLPDTQEVAGSIPAKGTTVRDAWRWCQSGLISRTNVGSSPTPATSM